MGNQKTKPYMIVGWKKYFNSTNPIIDVYLQKYGLKFIEQTFSKIKRAHLAKKPYIPLIKFTDDETISLLYQSEYQYALKLLLKLCIRIEYYEICSDIQDYITKMDTRKRRIIAKSKETVLK
jgi:hypothetical protein